MATLSPVPAMQDLKTTFKECILIFPSQATEKKSIFLSNMDQILNYNIPTVHFFSPNPDFPSQNVSKILKMALEKVLVAYDFMAGRLKLNHKTGCLEIDCNRAGAGFVVASCEFTFDEIRDFLVYPNLGFQQLAVQILHHLGPEDDQPLCIFQDKAKIDANGKTARISSFGVVAALIWRCKAFSKNKEYKKDTNSTLLNAIDIKSRVNPPLPSSYSDNAVLPIGLELHRGIPHGDYVVSSWLRLGFDQVVYPWGKPLYSCPVVNHRKDICWIFPNALDGGISAMVSLPHEEMVTFEALFHKIFA
ncbi:hypothetical protein BUALT_Bualt02G0141900 [Buddleja alternifolia]|uniref:Shikimate O-hydroxycinnamoyltransferase n=1 Tax=Buddleja alternifolia TaxID=168488 RepID=A0AAV6Y4C1_9LAMI|nr:hypothetical protein BUALT_Bualt02G0141900 [Buddleja alternifolia]